MGFKVSRFGVCNKVVTLHPQSLTIWPTCLDCINLYKGYKMCLWRAVAVTNVATCDMQWTCLSVDVLV